MGVTRIIYFLNHGWESKYVPIILRFKIITDIRSTLKDDKKLVGNAKILIHYDLSDVY